MKLAIQISWPNLTFSAEREFNARLIVAATALGWNVVTVTTSDEINREEPDMVLVTHEFCAKLTRFPTIGVIWSPVDYLTREPERIRNILSYDGYLVATEDLRVFVADLLAGHGKDAPISDFDFVPSALPIEEPLPDYEERTLFYTGVNWDGDRHGTILRHLAAHTPLQIYGNPDKWEGQPGYVGPLPFDGTSVVAAIRECGIGLAIHGEAHLAEGIPSMRLFECAAAGALIITDRSKFARTIFGDSVLYVDTAEEPAEIGRAIADHVRWANDHPHEASDMAARSHAIFMSRFALTDRIVSKFPAFVKDVRRSMGLTGPMSMASVDVILRVGSRPLEIVERAIASLAAQTHWNINLRIVSFKPIPGLFDLMRKYKPDFQEIERIIVPYNKLRSTSLWAGLGASNSDYVCNLDDDDVIYPNHIALMVRALESNPDAPAAYSGVIEVQEDDGYWFDQRNFRGDIDQVIEERRRIRFMEPFNRDKIWFDNYIQSNAWMARRSAITDDLLVDPRLPVAEDVCLYCSLAAKGDFVTLWSPTANWNWRSESKDNVMFQPELWQQAHGDLERRVANAGFAIESYPA